MQCSYFDAGLCRSCTLIEQSYDSQLAGKQQLCSDLLREHAGLRWAPPVSSPEAGFRNKAKLVVSGTVQQPTLGILDKAGAGIDLRDCGLHGTAIHACLPELANFITRAQLTPYDVPARRGELKYLLLTESPTGELMLRFVLRTDESLPRIRKHLATLLSALPTLTVVSANLHPEHKATLEGALEIALTEQTALSMPLNGIQLHLRPQSFFQTNTAIAAALYRQARDWVGELGPRSVWDLYCGVGGFALHCADPSREVVGIETSVEAIASAELSRDEAGLAGVAFQAADATAFALGSDSVPDLVIVNPPRRGIGDDLARWLEDSPVQHVIYSSCNAHSLARDLKAMPSLRPRRARLFDMFPNTEHHEVMVLLERSMVSAKTGSASTAQ
ncbi:23S rRNA (uracil(747)-C(5))-methyltransferase RlmC [Diaminobutyricimonas sp. TR449]|uniref:23S rRNA (uracil(747)-C(5))-methyltransferase RlmC n=1 Tax=Diaminobutyricimonas sp. TR449 TaxID=2708076 RepID=UPI001420729D|nr:23S rRNA (uracil(747)-C(5))-methyltransferase RlmC [Diaminobutyricimonas sp. TR449]